MPIIEIGTLPPRDVLDLLATMEHAVALLDVLGQIQTVAGTLVMQERARATFEVAAGLNHYTTMLKNAQERINR